MPQYICEYNGPDTPEPIRTIEREESAAYAYVRFLGWFLGKHGLKLGRITVQEAHEQDGKLVGTGVIHPFPP